MKIMNAQNQTVAVVPFGTNLSRFYAESGIDPESASVEYHPDEQRHVTRQALYKDVADLPTLVGVTADTAAINLAILAKLLKTLDTATTLEELRDGLAEFIVPLAALQDRLAAGTVKLPYQSKGGLEVVLPEIEAVSTQAAGVFEAS